MTTLPSAMTPNELVDAYEQLRGSHGLPPMRTEEVRIDRTPIPADPLDPAAAAARLAESIASFAPTQGWLCYQAAVIAFPPGDLPGPDAEHGEILSGELANGAREGLHIRPDGRGGWIVTRITPGKGEIYLMDDYSLIVHTADPGSRRQPRCMAYRRYWTPDDHHGIRQAAACFIGFDGGN